MSSLLFQDAQCCRLITFSVWGSERKACGVVRQNLACFCLAACSTMELPGPWLSGSWPVA